MKTIIVCVVLVAWAFAGTAQEVTELKEARIGFTALSSEVVRNGNEFTFNVKEAYVGEFTADPLAFLEANFDMKNFISKVKEEDYGSYVVQFRSRKGVLEADYDREGNLLRTFQRFQNIALPTNLREQLYRDHKGWAMVKNVHRVVGNNGTIKKNVYIVKLEKGKEKKTIRINGGSGQSLAVANL